MDGLYHAYLMVPSDGFNPRVVAGWTSLLVNAGEGIDVDFYFQREPKERIQAKLGQQIRINRSRIKDTSDTNTDFDDIESAIRSGYYLKQGLSNYEDFYYHALGIPNLSKLWQVNLIVVLFVLLYFLYHAFRDGIWGIRFRRETYDWNSGNRVLQKNAQYVGHALKNDLSKIEWCTDFLAAQGASSREVDILRRSAAHLKQFISRTQLYSEKISLLPEACDISELLRSLAEEFNVSAEKRGKVLVSECDSQMLVCDPAHVEEVLRNLIANGLDAAGKNGEVTISYQNLSHKRYAMITVADNGCGMDAKKVNQIFEPYYTTKAGGNNLGLGLYYCWNVMSAHGGSIRVTSEPGEGSTFLLLFPVKKRRRSDDGTNPDSGGRR